MAAPDPHRDDCPHATLGLTPGATDAEITAAYHRRIKQCHPDLQRGSAAAVAAAETQARCRSPAHVPLLYVHMRAC